jgi:ribosomal protein L11 methyltransferase
VLHTALTLDELNLHLEALEAAGLLGMVERDGVTSAYFAERREDLAVPGDWEPVPERDWNEDWKVGLEPVRVGGLVIAPPWRATGAADEVVIEPAQAFGTGHHETTTGCVAALQELDLAGRSVLDVGCGTGVLAVCAARLGAVDVVGVDVDPLAVEATLDNAERNGVRVEVHLGSVEAAGPGPFDVVAANLDTATLSRGAPLLAERLAPRGTLIASGVSIDRMEEALAALADAGLSVWPRRGREWVVFVATLRAHETRPRA